MFKNHKMRLLTFILISILFTSCFKNDTEKLLESAISIAGNKFESDWRDFKMHGHYSYAYSGGINGITPDRDGAASFNFYDDELEVYYSGATRVEELEGNIRYEREKYKLSNFELDEYVSESGDFKSKKISAKWDGKNNFYCYLKKYNKGSEKPSLNPQKQILDTDIYVLRFEVNWGGKAYAFLETTELSIEKQKSLLELFTNIKLENVNNNIKQNDVSIKPNQDTSSYINQDTSPYINDNNIILSDTIKPIDEQPTKVNENKAYFHIQDKDGFTNLRDGENGNIIRKIYPNELFSIIGSSGDYKIVQFNDGTNGYIHKSRIAPIKYASPERWK